MLESDTSYLPQSFLFFLIGDIRHSPYVRGTLEFKIPQIRAHFPLYVSGDLKPWTKQKIITAGTLNEDVKASVELTINVKLSVDNYHQIRPPPKGDPQRNV